MIASNYDPLLFPERPVHPDEVILSRYLERWRPDLAPVWSRYWLDLILSPRPVERRPPFLRPWAADTIDSRKVAWTRWENLYLAGPDAVLEVDLPHPTSRVVIGSVVLEGGERALRVHARRGGPDAGTRHRRGAWGHVVQLVCAARAGGAAVGQCQPRLPPGVRRLRGVTAPYGANSTSRLVIFTLAPLEPRSVIVACTGTDPSCLSSAR